MYLTESFAEKWREGGNEEIKKLISLSNTQARLSHLYRQGGLILVLLEFRQEKLDIYSASVYISYIYIMHTTMSKKKVLCDDNKKVNI